MPTGNGGDAIFGERLRHLRLAAGLDRGSLAARARISPSYLSRLESGKRGVPTLSVLARLARALDLPVVEMLRLAGVDVPASSRAEEPAPLYGLPRPVRQRLSQAIGVFTADDWADLEALMAAKLNRRPS